MHKVVEYGLASHWDYKAKSPNSEEDAVDYSSDHYLRSVQVWHWQQKSGAIQWDASTALDEQPEILMEDDVESRLRAEHIHKRTQRVTPYLEALNTAQSNLARDHVFVFLSQSSQEEGGNIMALPSGACVLDALREGGMEWKGAPSLNGSDTNLTRQLANGDILVVPTADVPVLTM
jgi:(p)ppGpp synthase/HD superfamily hydrolase